MEHIVARDAIVVYVHKDNPIKSISFEELACIYGEGGKCESWSSIGVEVPGCSSGEIIRVSRQSNSGTYEFFREAVLGKEGDFKLGSRDMQGSKDVVDLVTHTPCAIGYSGIGYLNDQVKAVCLAHDKGQPCILPTQASAADGSYPLSRPLYMYTLGEAEGPVADYLAWILTPAGQEIVTRSGFVAVK